MNIQLPPVGLSGRYRMVVSSDAEMRDVKQELEFDNLITNVGMNRLGAIKGYNSSSSVLNFGNICGRFVVGSGSAAPDFADTSLENPIAFASAPAQMDSQSSSYGRGWYEIVMRHQFGQGEAAGNLSKIGIQSGSSSGPLFSIALILDGAGNPTTITALKTDFLTCYYTLRIMIPQEDAVFNVNVEYDGVPTPTTVTARPFGTESSSGAGWFFKNYTAQSAFLARTNTGLVPPQTLASPGVNIPVSGSTIEIPYIPDSHELWIRSEQSLSGMNGKTTLILLNALWGGWQIHFDPPIVKGNTQTAQLTFGVSWARA